jgi:hypothetical protein
VKGLAALLLLGACGGAAPRPELGAWETTPLTSETNSAPRDLLLAAPSGDPAVVPKSGSPAARPPRVGPRDVRLSGARLDDALRTLAKVGRFGLVLSDPLAQEVSLELLRVEPFDALEALCQAHDLATHFERGVVMVSAGEAHSEAPGP